MNTTTQSNEKTEQVVLGALSLRDYFAAKAMQGFAVGDASERPTAEQMARGAYKWADAMIAERKK